MIRPVRLLRAHTRRTYTTRNTDKRHQVLMLGCLTSLVIIGTSLPLCGQNPNTSGTADVQGRGGAGGGAQADFDTLIDLIETTIAPDTWETVGGDGSIEGFPGGVYVDARGTLKQLPSNASKELAPGVRKARRITRARWGQSPLHDDATLRIVSLQQLLSAAGEQLAAGQPLDDAIRFLGGITRIDYVAIEDRDVMIAGPAGPWSLDGFGRTVGPGGRPVLRFDDLIVLMANAIRNEGVFICSITPTQKGLASAQDFANRSAEEPIRPGDRAAWLQNFRAALGKQKIEVQGVSAQTRVARVIVEADYHMKRIGIGLETGTPELSNYLERAVADGSVPQSIDVLRWWFTLRPDSIWQVAEETGVYGLSRQVTQILSENEMLAARGRRVATGRAHQLNAEFARDFTAELPVLADRYPIYAELDNVFRLALVANLINQASQQRLIDIEIEDWITENRVVTLRGRAPQWVDSIVNDVTVDRGNFLAAVSGGVEFRPPRLRSIDAKDDPFHAAKVKRLIRPTSTWWGDR